MTDTPNLALPEIAAAQAQKHVTHNEALRVLDALVQLAVADRDLAAPPGSPGEGQRWLVAAGASGAWAGHSCHIAAWQDGGWEFYEPRTGWLTYVIDESVLLAFDGSAWCPALDLLGSVAQNMSLLGVGTTADATNPFSAKLNNSLWVAKTVAEGGDGNLRYKMSKESAAKTLSVLFQDNFSGRAEIGLAGDDDFHFKVSADGSTWKEAIVIDRSTGAVSMPNTPGGAADLEITLAELSLGLADALNSAQFIGLSGNRFADSFDATTYVDVAGATNLDSGTAGLLKPTVSGGTTTVRNTGAYAGDSNYTKVAMDATIANGTVVHKIGVYCSASLSMGVKIVKRNSAGNFDVVVSETFTHPGGGWSDHTLASDYTVPGSGSYYLAVYENSAIASSSSGTARAYKAGDVTGTGQSGFSEDSGGAPAMRYVAAGSANNLTVTSTTLTAASAPATVKCVARVKEIDAITLNTDLVFSVSRDGGTTWTTVPMTDRFTAGSIHVLESGVVDISAQPSGTSMRWKAVTANGKSLELHDLYLYWA